MYVKYSFSILRPSKIYPNWDFWFENKPSGNPEFRRVVLQGFLLATKFGEKKDDDRSATGYRCLMLGEGEKKTLCSSVAE
jgi:hypothetical protein